MDDQRDVVAFLSRGESYGTPGAPVERLDTHISSVFLVGDRAYKLKRAVRYPYVDFSTGALRAQAARAELALNRRTAPQLYLGLRSITREAGGALAFDGPGSPVEWVIEMRRFDQADLFDRLAERHALTPRLMRDTADLIADFHAAAEPTPEHGGWSALIDVVAQNMALLMDACPPPDRDGLRALRDAAGAALMRCRSLLGQRRAEGRVRRCHGDLHLRNICLLEGRPTPFDCIEFNDRFACIDVLYDLAFLVMDLIHRDLPALANVVFNRYLDRSGDVGGLPAMPAFLALRAIVRAQVIATLQCQTPAIGQLDEARAYLAAARSFLRPAQPLLVAIGGMSGVGKSTLAQALGGHLTPAPGARIVRSDVLRKRLHGVAPEAPLPAARYDAVTTRRVYEAMRAEALAVLRAGYTVILDATFLDAEERSRAAALASDAAVAFVGLWLEAPPTVLRERIAARRDDASDADVEVLARQDRRATQDVGWHRLDAARDADLVVADMRALLDAAIAVPAPAGAT